MITPDPWHNMLRFDNLDNTDRKLLRSTVTIGWRIIDCRQDEWTQRFFGFKLKEATAVVGAARLVPHILRFTSGPAIAIAAAIPSGDRSLPADSPLRAIGSALQKAHGAIFLPDIVYKEPHQSLHSLESPSSRDREVAGKYSSGRFPPGVKHVIVLDDLVTRGSTLNDVARAIVASNSGMNVYGFCLGKNERRSWAATNDYDLNNSHIPTGWAEIWNG